MVAGIPEAIRDRETLVVDQFDKRTLRNFAAPKEPTGEGQRMRQLDRFSQRVKRSLRLIVYSRLQFNEPNGFLNLLASDTSVGPALVFSFTVFVDMVLSVYLRTYHNEG